MESEKYAKALNRSKALCAKSRAVMERSKAARAKAEELTKRGNALMERVRSLDETFGKPRITKG